MELYDKKFVYFEWNDILEGKKCFLANNPTDLKMNVNCGCTDCYGEVEQKSDKNFPFRLKNSKSWENEGCFVYYDPNYEIKKALLEGKKVQYYIKEFNKWTDLKLHCKVEDYLNNEDWDIYEWRIKPTEEIKYITIRALTYITGVSGIIMDISDEAPRSYIFKGSKEECKNLISSVNCIDLKCSECKNPSCNSCKKILDIIKVINAYHNELKTARRMTNRELSEWLTKGNGEIMENNGFSSINWCYPIGKDNEEVNDRVRIRKFGSDEWKEPLIEVK